ncbi:hypothetical protein OCGS_1265 [Oceaniovalibus guishaninsula JLT2003]|uniref:Uncharacterized protein n=1 Tax=Oceaniovalibus guishaninsula JLT2003 TaxID=1231392 RepID=K2HCV8_9RHOB|nr:type II and III secretion system protein family protein [Oceaniovalibus guishaninsula]EKE44427.1 hypothetical protein OCGS_1265 [Oceaniovalibus guishaninsula JLT2003]
MAHMKLKAALVALVCIIGGILPASAQGLRILSETASGDLQVPMNRAVVVESDTPFAELSIANPAIADISTLSDRTIYVLGKAPGRTTLTLLAADGRLITNVEVQVTPEISEFKERLRQILPDERIEVRTANDGIVLSGIVSSASALDRALDLANRYAPDRVSNLMSVGGTQQVMLKVRFAEMSRSVRKNLSSSVSLFGLSGDSSVTGGTSTFITAPNGVGPAGDGIGLGNVTVGPSEGVLGLDFGSGSLQFQVLLEALETKGLVRTLAEPNLSALSGQEASFLAGGEYPIPVVSDDGGVGIEYKPFGVQLNFTPRVVDKGVVNLQLNAAVSGIDSTQTLQANGFNVASFTRRETSTVVELRDGESFAIAGLLQDTFTDLKGQVPWLGDIPILGALFRSAEYNRNQSELVIIITAHLVSPVRGEALVLPTDRIAIPSERDLFLFGRTEGRVKGAAGEVARQDFVGSYGYVME